MVTFLSKMNVDWGLISSQIDLLNGGKMKHRNRLVVAMLIGAMLIINCHFWDALAATHAPLPKTGQTTSSTVADDGALQEGIAWPVPRFKNNSSAGVSNGTVTDNLTGLVWLKDANCFGMQTWQLALDSVKGLANGNVACGLNDGSTAGQWRLPNRNELESLIDAGKSTPSIPDGHPFSNVQPNSYWSSSTYSGNNSYAWYVYMDGGLVDINDKNTSS